MYPLPYLAESMCNYKISAVPVLPAKYGTENNRHRVCFYVYLSKRLFCEANLMKLIERRIIKPSFIKKFHKNQEM